MVGQTIGSYTIRSPIGKGGMGAVYLGIDNALERPVAIKVLSDQVTQDAVALQRFRTEAVTLARLSHPNIASVYNFLQSEGKYMLVMELVEGETLEQLLRRLGPLKPGEAAQLVRQALHGLAHAHSKGIIHRDIKPANLMLSHDGTVKITDFGIARMQGSTKVTSAGRIVGTPEYMSPEQIQYGDVDARADLYSMGVVLYELLTGRAPFTNSSEYEILRSHVEVKPRPARDMNQKVPAGLEKVIQKALAKRPQDRYQSAHDFELAVGQFATAQVPPAAAHTMAEGIPAYTPPPRTGPKSVSGPVSGPRTKPRVVNAKTAEHPRKQPVALYAGIAGAVLLLGGAIFAMTRAGNSTANSNTNTSQVPANDSSASTATKAPAVPMASANTKPADTLKTDLASAEAEKDPSSAIKKLQAILQQHPDSSEAKAEIKKRVNSAVSGGIAAYKAQDFRSAIDYFNVAVLGDPSNYQWHYDLAGIYNRNHDKENALAEAKKADQLGPSQKDHDNILKLEQELTGGN